MGTQTKIDKQSGLKQQLEWKQDIYRDLITKSIPLVINIFLLWFGRYQSHEPEPV